MIFLPQYALRLDSKSFNSDFACLGEQLVTLLDFLKTLLPSHVWLGVDLDAAPNTHLKEFSTFLLKKIGGDQEIIELVSKTDQFLSGVFIAVQEDVEIPLVEAGTEDSPFRPLDIDGVLIEIRTFDMTYFEIYTESKSLIETIASGFGVDIEKKGHPKTVKALKPGPLMS